MPKLIHAHADEMAIHELPSRAVVFADSDARYPGDLSEQARIIVDASTERGIDCLILSKRAVENYIPDEALRCWAQEPENQDRRPRVDAVCRLTAEQWDHVAMKKQYNPAKLKKEEERKLFVSVPAADVKTMRKADTFDDQLIDVLRSHRHCLSAEALRRRDGSGELDRLVTMIAPALYARRMP